MGEAAFNMKIIYSKLAKEQLTNIKEYIAADNPKAAIKHLKTIKKKIELLQDFPRLGKINATFNSANIREHVVLGYKVIYKINNKKIELLAIYKYLDLDEDQLDV